MLRKKYDDGSAPDTIPATVSQAPRAGRLQQRRSGMWGFRARARRVTSLASIVAVLATMVVMLGPAGPVGAATPPATVTFVTNAPTENVDAWNEHATAERTYRWKAVAAFETVKTLITSCGARGTKGATDTVVGLNTISASGVFTCIFDDGPGPSTVSVTAVNGLPVSLHTGTKDVVVDVANVRPATAIDADTPSTVAPGAGFVVSLTTATDDSATDTSTGMQYAVKCSTGAAYSAFGASKTGPCTAPTSGTSFTVYGKAKDKNGAESLEVSKVIDLVAAPEKPEEGVFQVGGEDRIETAQFLSRLEFPNGANVVFIATAFDYADALSTVPNSALEPGPILLTPINELAADTAAELTRLKPKHIIVAGGTAAVSAAVFEQLRPYASESVSRAAGVDRFGTAAALAELRFPGGAKTVYLATGRSYPDALAGGLAAGSESAPVLLTEKAALPAVTRAAIQRLKPTRIVIVGGSGSVSSGVASSLVGLAAIVVRISGADRYATTAAVVKDLLTGTDTVFVVTGRKFADALTGIPIAAMTTSGVLMVDEGPLHPAVVSELTRLKPRHILILGGTSAVSVNVANQLGNYIGAGTGAGKAGMQLTQEMIDNATS